MIACDQEVFKIIIKSAIWRQIYLIEFSSLWKHVQASCAIQN